MKFLGELVMQVQVREFESYWLTLRLQSKLPIFLPKKSTDAVKMVSLNTAAEYWPPFLALSMTRSFKFLVDQEHRDTPPSPNAEFLAQPILGGGKVAASPSFVLPQSLP